MFGEILFVILAYKMGELVGREKEREEIKELLEKYRGE